MIGWWGRCGLVDSASRRAQSVRYILLHLRAVTMSLSISDFFLASALINYSVLTIWLLMILVARDSICNIHAKIFDIKAEDVRVTHFKAMAYYKMGIFLLFLAPWIALEVIS